MRRRLFLSAERLIAEHGFELVSSRDITSDASANIAAINYYYGSKLALLVDIFRARAAELNGERKALLKAALAQQAPRIDDILRALIEPAILWHDPERQTALRYLNRARGEGPPEMQAILQNDVGHLARFVDAIESVCPALPREEIVWKLHFSLGVLHHNSAADYRRLENLSGGACDPGDRERLLERTLAFISAGFLA
ncbi:TetR/AcrR family transcriptional regulator [Flavisphingomonas formosensis]|uniref:TetR/AcrR family transcriptional regulator n=1 Tax=Flavisphingomonas formosensis TaxID=861534 RepID=UPI0012FA3E35|nr:TetR/AcrR family transcriptional regulator [Sphingomonas formosensis]